MNELHLSTQCSDSSLQAQIGDEDKRTFTTFIPYAPKSILRLQNILFAINALRYQFCHKGEKWHDLDIVVQVFDVTTDLSKITDTAKSDNPLQPYQLIILPLSREFVGLPFCYSEQMRPIFEDRQVEKRLLCILLETCKLEGYPFRTLPKSCYLPGNQRPVRGGRIDKIYKEIADEIERVIDDWKISE